MSSSLRVLRNRNFRFLFLGQSASAIGDSVVIVALALYITRTTGSATDLGLVLAAQTVPLAALVLIGGVVADRMPRQRVMLTSDAVRAVLHGGVAVLILAGGATIPELLIVEAAFGAARAFFQPAYTGLVPLTVDRAELQQAQGLTALTMNLAILIGPALGTLLVISVGAGVAFALDAATFAVSAVLLLHVHPRAVSALDPGEEHPSVLRSLREGWTEVWARPWFAASLAVFAVIMLCGYATWNALAPVIARDIYGGASRYGVLESVAGGGALVGAVIGMRWRPRHPLWTGLCCTLVWPVLLIAFSLHAPLVAVGVLAFGAGTGFAVFDVYWETSVAGHVPAEVLSRVSAYDWMCSLALLPVGFALAGPLGDAIGPRLVLGAGGVISGIALLASLLPRSTRTLPAPGVAPEQAPEVRPPGVRPYAQASSSEARSA
jgi:MFS family permease